MLILLWRRSRDPQKQQSGKALVLVPLFASSPGCSCGSLRVDALHFVQSHFVTGTLIVLRPWVVSMVENFQLEGYKSCPGLLGIVRFRS